MSFSTQNYFCYYKLFVIYLKKNYDLKLNKYVNLFYLRDNFFFNYKAYPCKPLSVPQNGALVCNGWSKDYGQFCLVFCGPQYSLDIQSSHRQWHVCGASGKWIPQERLPNCTGIFGLNINLFQLVFLLYHTICHVIILSVCSENCRVT